jgi:transposase
VDCVRKIGLKAFTDSHRAFSKKHHYIFQQGKPEKLFNASKELVAVFPKEKIYKLLIQYSIQQLNLASEYVERLRKEMNGLASILPDYSTVMGIYGVGKTYGPQAHSRDWRCVQIYPLGSDDRHCRC